MITYWKDNADNWYFSDGYAAPAHIAVLHLADLRKRGINVERIYSQPFNTHTL